MRRPLLLALLALFACAPPPPSGALVLAIPAPPETLDRRFALSTDAMRLCELVTPGLTRIDETGRAVPELAEHFEALDPLTWRFTLRDGLRFSDGTQLTAADVAATFRSILDPATGSPHRGGYAYVEEVEAPDARTVLFHLRRPFGALPVDATMAVLPAKLLGPEAREQLRRSPIGAGPYVVQGWDEEERLLLAPNPRWHGGSPPALPLEVRTVRDETTRLLELRKGRVDVVVNALSPALLPALRDDPALVVRTGPGNGTSYLMFQTRHPLLGLREVREAIAFALDREEIAAAKFRGVARPARGLLPPEHWAAAAELPERRRDLPRAKALLDAAGLPDPDGDGPAPRAHLTLRTSTDRFRRSLALVLRAQLAEVGLEVELLPLEWGTFLRDVRHGNFELATLKWPVIDPDLHRFAYHSASIPTEANGWGGGNRMRWSDARLDRLLDEARESSEPARRAALYDGIQRELAAELPALPLFHEDALLVHRRDVRGIGLDPYGSFRSLAAATREPSP